MDWNPLYPDLQERTDLFKKQLYGLSLQSFSASVKKKLVLRKTAKGIMQ